MKNSVTYFIFGVFLISIFTVFGYKSHFAEIKNNPKKPIEIELINKEIYFASLFSTERDYEYRDNNYKSEKELNNARNIIKYKISNNTNKKIFVLLRLYNLEMTFSNSNDEPSGIYYSIMDYEYNDLSMSISTGSGLSRNTTIDMIDCVGEIKDLEVSSTNYSSYYEFINYGNYTYINPGESMILKSYLRLPIPEESYDLIKLDRLDALHMYNNQLYKFQLHYIIKKEHLIKRLPQEVLEELKRKNIEIVDMDLETKIIDVKSR